MREYCSVCLKLVADDYFVGISAELVEVSFTLDVCHAVWRIRDDGADFLVTDDLAHERRIERICRSR